ncbi:MAG: two-component system alkaline phosphatase synthesis response regulator PhoP [Flavobacteriales bacterium]|jgi:two-component system alkaline phosphatase synthesis response regulator PhoP|tara:strand:+ start:23917 stop:24600 length:684 start_codon:yes stop_codon:yes gene_type:complete
MDEVRILIVDDEPDILEFVGYNLINEGFKVEKTNNGKDAIALNNSFKPDLIILDVMMPELDGIETCYQIKKDVSINDPKILFLTARSEDYSEISGLEAGADDYISKPVRPRVLLSRIKAILRRGIKKEETGKLVTHGEFTIDWSRYVVLKGDQKLVLPRKEMELFGLLFSIPGKVFERNIIMNKVWGTDVIVGDRTIDVHIRKLREKFGDACFETVKGVGYKFILPS